MPLPSRAMERASALHRTSGSAKVAPTNGNVETTGIDLHEFEGELVERVHTQTDAMDLGRQTGRPPQLRDLAASASAS